MLMCFNRVELYSEKMENDDDEEIIFLNYFLLQMLRRRRRRKSDVRRQWWFLRLWLWLSLTSFGHPSLKAGSFIPTDAPVASVRNPLHLFGFYGCGYG